MLSGFSLPTLAYVLVVRSRMESRKNLKNKELTNKELMTHKRISLKKRTTLTYHSRREYLTKRNLGSSVIYFRNSFGNDEDEYVSFFIRLENFSGWTSCSPSGEEFRFRGKLTKSTGSGKWWWTALSHLDNPCCNPDQWLNLWAHTSFLV